MSTSVIQDLRFIGIPLSNHKAHRKSIEKHLQTYTNKLSSRLNDDQRTGQL